MWVRLRVICPVPTDIPTLWVRCQRIKLDLIGRQIIIFRLFYRDLWTSLDVLGSGSGAAKRIRTPDPRITNALLYQLSYCGVFGRGGILPRGVSRRKTAAVPGHVAKR